MCRWGQIDQSWCCGQEQMVACNKRTRLKKEFVIFITVTLAQHQLGHHRLDHGRDLWQRSQAGSGCLKALIWTPELKSIMKRLQIVSRIIVVTKRNLLQQSMHWLNFSESTTPPWARASRTQVDLKKMRGERLKFWSVTADNGLWTKMLGLMLVVIYLANQFWPSVVGRACEIGRRRRERRVAPSLLLQDVLVVETGACVSAILVPCAGRRICACTAVQLHRSPAYIGRCRPLAGRHQHWWHT